MSAKKSVRPSVKETAFDCPHCGAYTSQTWFTFWALKRPHDDRLPSFPDREIVEVIARDENLSEEGRRVLVNHVERFWTGQVFFDYSAQGKWCEYEVQNLWVSQCFVCSKFGVWIHDKLISPSLATGPSPNADLPTDVLADYEEASRILAESPRSAAGLLRLAIQKLCAFLGEKGKKIDDDIASLVQKGLSPLVQQSLDAVRVIGNEAVHPGTIDLKDDIETASRLFGLVNIIAEQMITNPKHVREIYESLPEAKRKAIAERDAKPGKRD